MEHRERVAGVGMSVESFGQQHVRAQVHGSAPEVAQQLALDSHVLDVLGLGRVGNGRDLLIQRDPDDLVLPGIDRDPAWPGVEVPGLAVPLLTFALVRRQLDHLAIGAAKGLIPVEEPLDPILARRDVREAPHGIPRHFPVEGGFLAGSQALDVHPEDHLGVLRVADLKARLGQGVGGDYEVQAPIQRRRASGRREAHAEAGSRRLAGPCRRRPRGPGWSENQRDGQQQGRERAGPHGFLVKNGTGESAPSGPARQRPALSTRGPTF